MPLQKGSSAEVISQNIEEMVKNGHPRNRAIAAAYREARQSGKDGVSARQYDINGWPEIRGNPLSKVGVFPYLGKQISPELDPEKVYNVYRPEEELSSPSCLESFKLIPWVDIHPDNLLGRESDGRIAAEKKGVEGVTGEDIYFDNGILYGNIKLFSDNLQDLVDSGEHKELSLGYGCRYEIKSGTWNGQRYDVIQRDIRGNHLASVPQGRMGPDVAVLDHIVFSLDAKDIKMPEEKEKEGETEIGVDEVNSFLKKLGKDYATVKSMVDKHFGQDEEGDESEGGSTGADADEEKKKEEKAAADKVAADKAAADKAAKDEEEKKEKEGMDKTITALDSQVKVLTEQLTNFQKGGMKALLSDIAKRDVLANRISQFVGAFDHADKTLDEVAAYGVEKLGITCPKGSEQIALDAYLVNRKPPVNDIGFSLDGASGGASKTTVADFYSKAS